MKRLFIVFPLLLICSCLWLQKKPKTPEEIAVLYYKALKRLDLDEAARYCEEETGVLVRGMRQVAAFIHPSGREANNKEAELIRAATCTITGNIANCVLCCDKDGLNRSEFVTLRLQDDGHWLVFINKEDFIVNPEE